MTVVDSAKLLYVVLASDASLVAEVTNVVDGSTVLDMYGPPGMPVDFHIRKMLFFLGDGGPGDEELPIASESFSFFCYGDNAAEARSVYRKLRAALHRKSHTRYTIDGETHQFQWAQLLSGPQDDTDPVEGWNRILCSFLVTFIETTL